MAATIEASTKTGIEGATSHAELLRFERLLSDVSAGFIDLPAARIDEAIEDGLRRIVETLGIDRSTLSSVDQESGHFHSMHSWALPGLQAVPNTVSSATFPWVLATMRAGKPIVFASLDEMPPEASLDRRSYAEIGLKSHVAVPVIVAGELMAVLGFGAMRRERTWSADLIGRMRLLAQVFASALARKRAEAGERLASAEAAHLRDRLAHMARVHTVGAMSAAIAHEVNQPLMAIANYARAGRRRLAGTNPIDRGKLDELLDKVATQAALAGEVLNRLRAMVKRHDAEMDAVDVAQMIAKTLKLVEMESELKDVRIECAIAAELPLVLADDIQVQQVLLNLVRNAMEAMTALPGQKALRIEAMASGDDDVVVSVVDRGPGIAVADEEKIFEPFFTTKASGLGIGLSICRTIVEAHGGRLWHLPNPDGGATFQFTLPIDKEGD